MRVGEERTVSEVLISLRRCGYGDLVDRAVQTRNRQEITRQELETIKDEIEDPFIRDNVQILMEYALGWTSALRASLSRRNKVVPITKPKTKSAGKEPIDFSLGDPVAVLYNKK